jgi:hypothetical protein
VNDTGISLACTNSTVQGNTITDATDGAIVSPTSLSVVQFTQGLSPGHFRSTWIDHQRQQVRSHVLRSPESHSHTPQDRLRLSSTPRRHQPVDFAPYAGDYTGTTVTNNAVTAQSDFIKIGIAVGFNVWSLVALFPPLERRLMGV